MVVFFIFLVANVGGALTPLGDPPLFLGFLKGVPFFWTMEILPHMLLAALTLLAAYFLLDLYFYRREGAVTPAGGEKKSFSIEGWQNFLFLLGIIGAVLLSGVARWGEVSIFGVRLGVQDIVRDALLVAIIALSLAATPRRLRDENEFTWFPLKEVAILFAAIFLTMVPCLKMLQAGPRGALAFVTASLGEPVHYFWLAGFFSSFLDNAPTYLTFLNAAIGGFYPHAESVQAVGALVREHPVHLEAISAGAVFFGAFTYIGNAPNFMVRSIAEEAGTPMPGFFGFMLKYSLPVLLPVYVLVAVVFF
jgi:Na+/H+ antiporter NhaD/arsenite permease-like protein